MFNSITEIPAHPLLVHLPVVGIPFVALLALVAAFLRAPKFGRFRILVTGLSILVLVSVFPARMSGEELLAAKGFTEENPGPVAEHAQFANYSLAATIALVALLALFTFMHFSKSSQRQSVLSWIVSAGVCVAAIAAIVTTVITGHEGALLVWKEVGALPRP